MRSLALADWPAEIACQIAALRPATAAALAEIGAGIAEAAREKIGHYQDGWALLAESTVEEKERLGYAPPDNPLLREGDLRDSISFFTDGMMTVIGSPSPIARWQELGTDRIPPRPFIGAAAFEAEALIRDRLGSALVNVLSGRYRP